MRHDHRPYRLKRLFALIERTYLKHQLAPQADAFGADAMVLKPWHVRLHGANIRIGQQVHIIAAADRRVSLTSWHMGVHAGAIDIGNYCLICPGVRIDSATQVSIGSNCMLAAGAYISDADWHDLYDRTQPVGACAPVVLEDNVWIGDGAMVCKGVRIGANSIVGARSIVTRDVEPNSIVGGNPASLIRMLDPNRTLIRRKHLLEDPQRQRVELDQLDRYMLNNNGWWNWLISLLAPTRRH